MSTSATLAAPTGAPVRPRWTSDPRYAPLRLGGALAAGLILAAGTMSTIPSVLQQQRSTPISLPAGVTTLRLDSRAGDVTVRPAMAGETPGAVARSTWWGSEPAAAIQVDGAVATLTSGCSPDGPFGGCSTDWQLVVPDGVSLAVTTTLGDLDVQLDGPADLRSTAGDMTITGTSPDLRASATLGDITATLDSAPDEARITTTSGDISVTVPRTDDYAVSLESKVGEQHVELPRATGGRHRLTLTSTIGDLSVTGD